MSAAARRPLAPRRRRRGGLPHQSAGAAPDDLHRTGTAVHSERLEVVELLGRLVPFGLLVAAALGGRPGCLEAVVLAAPAEHLGAGHDGRLPVEDDRVVLGADGDAVTRTGARLHQLLFHTKAVEAVG